MKNVRTNITRSAYDPPFSRGNIDNGGKVSIGKDGGDVEDIYDDDDNDLEVLSNEQQAVSSG